MTHKPNYMLPPLHKNGLCGVASPDRGGEGELQHGLGIDVAPELAVPGARNSDSEATLRDSLKERKKAVQARLFARGQRHDGIPTAYAQDLEECFPCCNCTKTVL